MNDKRFYTGEYDRHFWDAARGRIRQEDKLLAGRIAGLGSYHVPDAANTKFDNLLTQDELNKSLRNSKRELEQSQTRIRMLDNIIQRLYENNIEGKIFDERFMKMNVAYEAEQHTFESRVAELKSLIASEKENSANVDAFLSIVRKYSDIQELTAEIIREFVEKIYVYNAEKVNGKRIHKIRIVWNCIGEFDVPHERINGAAG